MSDSTRMTVEQQDVVDLIGVEKETGDVVLTIVDDLSWASEQEHLRFLQGKLNTYMAFVESGEIDEAYPDARGRDRVIDVVCRFPLTDVARDFYARAAAILTRAEIELRHRILASDD